MMSRMIERVQEERSGEKTRPAKWEKYVIRVG